MSGHVVMAVMALAVLFDRCSFAYPPLISRYGAQVTIDIDTGWVSHWWIFTCWGSLRPRWLGIVPRFTVAVMRSKDDYWWGAWWRSLVERGIIADRRAK